jgi:hypothetical protein
MAERDQIQHSSPINPRAPNIRCKVRVFESACRRCHRPMLMFPGVMRFLQTEWHRHERDRNSWEIERQEMKARIARLEGATRKSDGTISSLKKYVSMLEKALKERDEQVKRYKSGADPGLASSETKATTAQQKDSAQDRRKLSWSFYTSAFVNLTC